MLVVIHVEGAEVDSPGIVLIHEICLRAQVGAVQKLNARRHDDDKTRKEFFHAAKNKRTDGCLSVRVDP